ncbi:MAG: homoserine dehydrogenase [Actinobacteria bacterium]|uniref:Homoserine dehydrogenase n=2 Tax=freshwater metagenome TaxID=449393 RepID=A0A6J6HGP3_9ZZZZ|nr:homoserine dehydrogenase [Actinomycetota bacterium]MSZ98762.1 homoserine dehydrogenase [Actinomycetota bacterium]MTH91221.1 homoserine dehydrogenase [Actinomycetota bacterium]
MSSHTSANVVRLGVLGHGVVGSAFVELVSQQSDNILARSGVRLEVAQVCIRDTKKKHTLPKGAVLVSDPHALVQSSEVDVVVELMGGIDPASELIFAALKANKPVITANKALLARHGAELFGAADDASTDLLFEAAVCGGIPLVRPLRESLRGEPIIRVMGIVNGTTNFILTKMSEHGADYQVALAEAQQLGFAEADPTADVQGHDAAAKIAIIASIAFGTTVRLDDVYCEGITEITAADIAIARKFGFAVKLLGVAELAGVGSNLASSKLSVRVHPALVPLTNPLAAVRESFNAVVVDGRASGSLMFYGRGAGGEPTASAVLGDVIDAAINLRKDTHAPLGAFTDAKLLPISEINCEYMIGLEVADKPGVLHAVTGVFARNSVSIRAAEQDGIGSDARLVFLTHDAKESAVQSCLTEFKSLDAVKHVGALLRVVAG